ncbi:DEKNAAC100268 [Brettanomyces naardenensis]|uniref:DEKNAAC100268 n=1 Tax=Brettanomyces naardenensis TaxID=13370 RepID=A0A448YG62_BRENA|nr:DEKNAAC100268 [Brettanomyces naardenensis]
MSWSGFKKAVNRAGAHVMMKASKHSEVSVDAEFDQKEESFKKFDRLTSELEQDMSMFMKNFEDLIEVQLNIVKTIDSFYGDYSFELGCDRSSSVNQGNESGAVDGEHVNPRDGISLEYLKLLNEIKDMVLPELLEPLQITVMDPVTELKSYNEEIQRLIKKRGRKKFDYDVLKTKFDKAQREVDILGYEVRRDEASEKKDQLIKQMERLDRVKEEFGQAESIYIDLNGRLKSEVDQYLSLRYSLLDPTFESFIKIQMKLYGDMYERLTSSNLSIDAMTIDEHNADNLDNRLDEILGKMKSLGLLNMARS